MRRSSQSPPVLLLSMRTPRWRELGFGNRHRYGHLPEDSAVPDLACPWPDHRPGRSILSPAISPLTITRAISIVAQDVEAVIGAEPAAPASRGCRPPPSSAARLTIDMRGTANMGISFVSGKALHVQNSVIHKATSGSVFAYFRNERTLPCGYGVWKAVGTGSWYDRQRRHHPRFDRVGWRMAQQWHCFPCLQNLAITATVRDSVVAATIHGYRCHGSGGGTVFSWSSIRLVTISPNAAFTGGGPWKFDATGNGTAIGTGPVFS